MIVIVFAVLFLWMTFFISIRAKRVYYHGRLEMIFERMEFLIIKERLPLNKDLISFIRMHKNFVVNPKMADIQILLLSSSSMSHNDRVAAINNFNKILNSFPQELKKTVSDFQSTVSHLILLSMARPSFIAFIIPLAIASMFRTGIQKLPVLYSEMVLTFKNIPVVSAETIHVKTC